MTPSPRPPVATIRGLVASLTLADGTLHLAIAPGRSADWRAEGIALAVTGTLLIAFAIAVVLHRSRSFFVATSIVSALVITALVGSRTVGYPFGPWSTITPPMGPYETVVTIVAFGSLALALGALVSEVDHLGATGWRFENLAPMAVVLVALPGFVTSQWADDAAHVSGSTHRHVHYPAASLEPGAALSNDERAGLGRQLTAAANAIASYPTLGAAEAAGWIPVGGYVAGAGQMLIDPSVDSRAETLAFDRPSGLLYESSQDEARLVGAQYNAWTSDGSTPTGFTGPADVWHLHDGTCIANRGVWALPHDEAITGNGCSRVEATFDDTTSWMLRVWLVLGWENPAGVFAHDHPALS